MVFEGKNLLGGTFYNCRFGSELVPAQFPEGLLSLAGVNENSFADLHHKVSQEIWT